MKLNLSKIVFTILTILSDFSNSYGQKYVGFSGGGGVCNFFTYSKNKASDAKHHLGNANSASFFYESIVDSNMNLRVELQYLNEKVNIKFNNQDGHFSFYRNLNYSFQILNLNLIYTNNLVTKKHFSLAALFGPSFSYLLNSKSEGNGWDFISISQVDSSGNIYSVITTNNWKQNENNPKELSKYAFGFSLGFEFCFPVNNRFDLLIQNKYFTAITNVFKNDKLKYTSLWSGLLNLELRYHL